MQHLLFKDEALFCLSLSSQSPICDSFSSIFQGLLSHNDYSWKEGYIISSVHQTRHSEVPAKHTSSGSVQQHRRAAPCVPRAGPASPGMFAGKPAVAHTSGFCVTMACLYIALAIIIFLF